MVCNMIPLVASTAFFMALDGCMLLCHSGAVLFLGLMNLKHSRCAGRLFRTQICTASNLDNITWRSLS